MSDPNRFTEEELKFTPQDSKERLNSLPKLDTGAFDLESMTPEQKAIYWEEKSKASTRGHHDYRNKTEAEMEILRQKGIVEPQKPDTSNSSDYQEAFKSLGITDKAQLTVLERMGKIAEENAFKRIASDPAFVGSIEGSNLNRLDQAFTKLSQEDGYEPVMKYKEEIISRYFTDPLAIPQDVYAVLKPIAGGVLFEHRDEIVAGEKPKHDRVDMLGGQGGDKKVSPARSIEYWERIAQENPQEFAKPEVQKLFNEDMAKLKE